MAFVSDLDPQRIEEHQRIDRLQRPRLPGRYFVQHRVGDGRDQVGRHVDPVNILDMPHDLTRAHPTRIHRHDLLVEAREAALILGKQLRIKARLPVARDGKLQRAAIRQHCLAAVAIAAVADGLFVGEMMIHLRIQRPLRQRLLQLIEQTVALESRFRIRTGEKLVQNAVRDDRLFPSCHGWSPSYPLCTPVHEIPDSPVDHAGAQPPHLAALRHASEPANRPALPYRGLRGSWWRTAGSALRPDEDRRHR